MSYRLVVLQENSAIAKIMTDWFRSYGHRNEIPIFILAAREGTPAQSIQELRDRIENMLREPVSPHRLAYRFGGMRVNFLDRVIVRKGQHVRLSEREARMLSYFVQNRGQIITRRRLLEYVWDYPGAAFTRTVDVHIARLRKKIEPDSKQPCFIVTVPGLGYRFDG